ncbi:hypothetical protein [Spirillospora sp. CA-294931]|uniref:hypothetical protein n=1 Tax=Spirillospora sp. CA-294931 TaxID=3240042 RepID=UPI003D916BE6
MADQAPQGGAWDPTARVVPANDYAAHTYGPVAYYPVTLGGELIGFLWASRSEPAAGFWRRVDGPEGTFLASGVWSERLMAAHARGLSAVEAIRDQVGAPEHPEAGTVAAGAPEGEASGLAEIDELANPGNPADPDAFADLDRGLLPDGTPIDRSKGWGPLSLPNPSTYPDETSGPVVYLPVAKEGRVVGYVWASPTREAASYLERAEVGVDGWNAGVPWKVRLRDAHAEGLPAIEALRRLVGTPPDPRGGEIPAGTQEREAGSLDELRELAGGTGR